MKKVSIKQSKNVLKRKENSKSINTQNKYNGDWLKFIDYCKYKHNCSPTDVDGLESAYNLVAEYLDCLCQKTTYQDLSLNLKRSDSLYHFYRSLKNRDQL